MTSITETASRLLISRMFAAMRERVWRAWTDSAELKHWWHVDGGTSPSITEVDLRIGGRYRLGMVTTSNDEERVCSGVFRLIEAPERLNYTWRWEHDPDPYETEVTIELFDHGKNTEVVVVHEGFRSRAECDEHAKLWNGCLAQLATLLHEIESPPIELCMTIDVPEEKVFHALTDAQQLMRWFPTLVENEPVPGGKLMFAWEYPQDPNKNHMRCGEYVEVIPNKVVSHTWDVRPRRELGEEHPSADEAKSTVVEYRLTPEGDDSTRLMLVHSGWEMGPEWDRLREAHVRAWTFYLANLKSYLESGRDDREREMGMRCAEVVQDIRY